MTCTTCNSPIPGHALLTVAEPRCERCEGKARGPSLGAYRIAREAQCRECGGSGIGGYDEDGPLDCGCCGRYGWHRCERGELLVADCLPTRGVRR